MDGAPQYIDTLRRVLELGEPFLKVDTTVPWRIVDEVSGGRHVAEWAAKACPSTLRTSEEGLSIVRAERKRARGAQCAGVVAKGYDLTKLRVKINIDDIIASVKADAEGCDATELTESEVELAIPSERGTNSKKTRSNEEKDDVVGAGVGNLRGKQKALQLFIDQLGDVHREVFPQRLPRFTAFPDFLDTRTCERLKANGVTELYEHQATAIRAALQEDAHVFLTTGFASGKTFAFAIPLLESFYRSKKTAKVLLLYPTKSLAQDQLAKLKRFFGDDGPKICAYDGDASFADRRKAVLEADVFLTNPDTIHATILHDKSWRRILAHISFVVIDEAHVYSGDFGSQVSLVFRRLVRLCRTHAKNINLRFIAASATMCHPEAFFRSLIGLYDESDNKIVVVEEDHAGCGTKTFAFILPQRLDTGSGTKTAAIAKNKKRRRVAVGAAEFIPPRKVDGEENELIPLLYGSSISKAATLFARAVKLGLRVVCFVLSRTLAELVLDKAIEKLPADLHPLVASYRAGYTKEERRAIEAGLFGGTLRGVVATNALELGVDVGDLQVTLHCGLPKQVSSIWQQAGRAGRSVDIPSVAVILSSPSPLDQYFVENPKELLGRKLEIARFKWNKHLATHVYCACEEEPVSVEEMMDMFGPAAFAVIQENECRFHFDKGVYQHCLPPKMKQPYTISLRNIDAQFSVFANSQLIETLDFKLALLKCYPGAIYRVQKTTYFVDDLDVPARHVRVTPVRAKLDFFTIPRDHTRIYINTESLPTHLQFSDKWYTVHCGHVTVSLSVYGYHKKRITDMTIVDTIDLQLPEQKVDTDAVWMEILGATDEGLHALEHCMIRLAPSFDVGGLSCQHTRRSGDTNHTKCLLYGDEAENLFDVWSELLHRACRAIRQCPCEKGCPHCVVTECAEGFWSKEDALLIANRLCPAKIIDLDDSD